MKTKEQILDAIKNGKSSECIDGRDFSRLCDYFKVEDWGYFGMGLAEGATPPEPEVTEFTEENILKALKSDLAFGFEKALNCRGISSDCMYNVIKMWLWILDNGLQHFDSYAMYGLPLFRLVAIEYGFNNPIGDDIGNETKYAEET